MGLVSPKALKATRHFAVAAASGCVGLFNAGLAAAGAIRIPYASSEDDFLVKSLTAGFSFLAVSFLGYAGQQGYRGCRVLMSQGNTQKPDASEPTPPSIQ